jgi:tripartite-type tricarboxylate transporter receptor subunit TctC
MLSRRTMLGGLAAAPGILVQRACSPPATQNVRSHLIVPFAAGGNADIVGRIAGDQLAKNLNGSVVVENRGGAGGSIGAEYVAKAPPDGYTLLVGSNGPLTVNPFVHAQLGYDPLKDFAPVGLTS